MNDILILKDSGSIKNLGCSSLYKSNDNPLLWETCFGIRIKDIFKNRINPEYVNTILKWVTYRKRIWKLVKGSLIFHLYKSEFSKLKIKLPSYENQLKISNLFYKFYKLIETEEKLIQKQETLKTYLIDNMFA